LDPHDLAVAPDGYGVAGSLVIEESFTDGLPERP
jgi:hypothetical protein